MSYTKRDIWNDLSKLQATMYKDFQWQKDIREIMNKILKELEEKNDKM